MTSVDGFAAYKYYLAIRNHFKTKSYDVFKYRGKVTATKSEFLARKDVGVFNRLASQFNEQELTEYMVANHVQGASDFGVFDLERGRSLYRDWKQSMDNLERNFEIDLQTMCDITDIKKVFVLPKTGKHSPLIRFYLSRKIRVETLIMLDYLTGFRLQYDKMLAKDLVWPDISFTMEKYKPFIVYDKSKIEVTYDKFF